MLGRTSRASGRDRYNFRRGLSVDECVVSGVGGAWCTCWWFSGADSLMCARLAANKSVVMRITLGDIICGVRGCLEEAGMWSWVRALLPN